MSSRWNNPVLKKVSWRKKLRKSGVLPPFAKLLLRVKFIVPNDSVSREVLRDGQKEAVDYSSPERGRILRTVPCCFKRCFLRIGNVCCCNQDLIRNVKPE